MDEGFGRKHFLWSKNMANHVCGQIALIAHNLLLTQQSAPISERDPPRTVKSRTFCEPIRLRRYASQPPSDPTK